MTDWQPIETAPYGVPILCYVPPPDTEEARKWHASEPPYYVLERHKAEADDPYEWEISHDGDGGYLNWRGTNWKPTHWQHLEPPK